MDNTETARLVTNETSFDEGTSNLEVCDTEVNQDDETDTFGQNPLSVDDNVDDENDVAPLTSQLKRAAGFAALGGVLFGYDIGIISGALLQIGPEFSLNSLEKEMVVGTMLVGAMIASLTGGFLIDYAGRRNAIVGNSVLFVIAAASLAASPSYQALLVARFIVGYSVALSAVSECVYISEISPPSRRGFLVSLNELGIAVGIFASYVANYVLISDNEGWRIMFGISAIPAVIQGLGMMFLPPSPRWLLLKGHRQRAISALAAFRYHSDEFEMVASPLTEQPQEEAHSQSIINEIDQIQNSISLAGRRSTWALLKDPTIRKTMFISCTLVIFQQLTGQPNVLFYGSTLFRESGFNTAREATLANMILGALKLVATIFAVRSVDHLGRRKLLLVGTCIMLLSLLTLAWIDTSYPVSNEVTSNFSDFSFVDEDERYDQRFLMEFSAGQSNPLLHIEWSRDGTSVFLRKRSSHEDDAEKVTAVILPPVTKWVTLGSLFAFVIAYAFSYGPVSWLILSEVFADDVRARAVAIATVFNWSSNFAVSASFLTLLENIGLSGTFFMYSGINVLALAFVYGFIPETKGKTFEEIESLIARSKICSMSCGRKESYVLLEEPLTPGPVYFTESVSEQYNSSQ